MTRNPPVKVQIGPYYTYSGRFGQKKCRNALYALLQVTVRLFRERKCISLLMKRTVPWYFRTQGRKNGLLRAVAQHMPHRDTGNTLFPRGRNCGKSATDGVMRVDAARKKAKMREIVDAAAVRMH
jgi:hypothetical protein